MDKHTQARKLSTLIERNSMELVDDDNRATTLATRHTVAKGVFESVYAFALLESVFVRQHRWMLNELYAGSVALLITCDSVRFFKRSAVALAPH